MHKESVSMRKAYDFKIQRQTATKNYATVRAQQALKLRVASPDRLNLCTETTTIGLKFLLYLTENKTTISTKEKTLPLLSHMGSRRTK